MLTNFKMLMIVSFNVIHMLILIFFMVLHRFTDVKWTAVTARQSIHYPTDNIEILFFKALSKFSEESRLCQAGMISNNFIICLVGSSKFEWTFSNEKNNVSTWPNKLMKTICNYLIFLIYIMVVSKKLMEFIVKISKVNFNLW